MKNTKREVVERLVPFNYGELEFLRRMCASAESMLRASSSPAVALVERVQEKIGRAQRSRYGR